MCSTTNAQTMYNGNQTEFNRMNSTGFDVSERVILDHILENSSRSTENDKVFSMCTKNVAYLTVFRMLNMSMLIFATALLFVGYILVSNYCMDKIYLEESVILGVYWPFYYFPWSLIGISVSSLCISAVLLMTESSRLKVVYLSYAIAIIFLALTNFGCLFSALQSEKLIEIGTSKASQEQINNEVIKQFHQKEEFRSAWNDLQIRLRCCGADNYDDFFNALSGRNLYPDSCEVVHNNDKQCNPKASIPKYE